MWVSFDFSVNALCTAFDPWLSYLYIGRLLQTFRTRVNHCFRLRLSIMLEAVLWSCKGLDGYQLRSEERFWWPTNKRIRFWPLVLCLDGAVRMEERIWLTLIQNASPKYLLLAIILTKLWKFMMALWVGWLSKGKGWRAMRTARNAAITIWNSRSYLTKLTSCPSCKTRPPQSAYSVWESPTKRALHRVCSEQSLAISSTPLDVTRSLPRRFRIRNTDWRFSWACKEKPETKFALHNNRNAS